MNRADVLRMALDAGFGHFGHDKSAHIVTSEVLERFAALLTADACAARIAAQTENEALKARLAASGVAERRAVREAVLAEREACALVAEDSDHVVDVPGWDAQLGDANATARNIAAAIRARGAA